MISSSYSWTYSVHNLLVACPCDCLPSSCSVCLALVPFSYLPTFTLGLLFENTSVEIYFPPRVWPLREVTNPFEILRILKVSLSSFGAGIARCLVEGRARRVVLLPLARRGKGILCVPFFIACL